MNEIIVVAEVDILFIVNGEDVPIRIKKQATLVKARDKALVESRNMSRPLENWEIRSESGNLLEPDQVIEEFNFVPGVRLFLTLRIGAGG